MKRWLLLACLAMPTAAAAQTGIDLNTASFYWDWVQGGGDPATEFRIKCGQTPGTYPLVTVIANPIVRSYPVKTTIAGSGTYRCIVTAANQYGESDPSAEVFFVAGVRPSSPSNFRLTP